MLAEIERLKRENEALRAPKRAEAVILSPAPVDAPAGEPAT
jgi:hypothetical protein